MTSAVARSNQLTFDFSAKAHRTDPITSHRAADTINQSDTLSNHEQFALEAIQQYPGRSAQELEAIVKCKPGKIWKRIAALIAKNKVRREYPKNCKQGRWYIQEASYG